MALGVALPTVCGRTAVAGARTAIWQGPDEWLVLSRDRVEELVRVLGSALGEDAGSVVDLSANRTILELAGPSARDVLEKGCSIDLHPRAFGPGNAVSTSIAAIPVVLWQIDGAPTYRLLPRASFADYLARWLVHAMGEYALTEVA